MKTLVMPYKIESEHRILGVSYHDRWNFASGNERIIGSVREDIRNSSITIHILDEKSDSLIEAVVNGHYKSFATVAEAKQKLDEILVNEMNCRLLTEDEVDKLSLLL